MFQDSSYKKPLFFAVLLHIVLFVSLFLHFIPKLHLGPGNEVKIINASVVRSTSMPRESIPPQTEPVKQAATQKLIAGKTKAEEQKEQQAAALLAQQKAAEQKKAAQKLAHIKAAQEKAQAEQAKRKAALQKQQRLAQQLKQTQQQMLQQQLAQEQKQLQAASAVAANNEKIRSELDKYKALILQAIGQNWLIPDGADKTLSCILSIQLAPDGTVLGVQVSKSSGNTALDQSATSAVLKASPLPVPTDAQIFDKFRNLRLTVRPEDIMQN